MITDKNLKVSAIIAAGGRGDRAGFGYNKLLAPLYGEPVLWHTIKKFVMPEVDEIVVASAKADFKTVCKIAQPFNCKVILGGQTRTESVKRALEGASGDIVLIHDGARPFVSKKLILQCIDSVVRFGSGVCAVPATEAVCSSDYGMITSVHDRAHIFNLQTPQGFFADDIKKAYELAGDQTFYDDSSVYCRYMGFPRLVEGEPSNKKLTFFDDFFREAMLPMPCGGRVGFGVDVHAFEEGDGVVLGGVKIPLNKKLAAHSDGDVVFHAVMDSLLSAAGLEDIGRYFPESDPKYSGANSAKMCRSVLSKIKEAGFAPVNISVSIQAERPRLENYKNDIRANIAKTLGIDQSCVAVAAGTCEGLGFVGEGLGIAAYAYVAVNKV